MAELLPILLPKVGISALFEGSRLLRPLLRLLGFGPQGPIKGMFFVNCCGAEQHIIVIF
jgi:hypothetical protein